MKNVNRLLKNTVKERKNKLCAQFQTFEKIPAITDQLVDFIDSLLLDLFKKNQLGAIGHSSFENAHSVICHKEDHSFCLIALGSYGRRELQLYSDIDLLLLHPENITEIGLHRAQQFLQDCWDIGLEVSHQITTTDACTELASNNLSVVSTLMDMRFLCGQNALIEELQYKIHPLHIWPSHKYFFAKIEEQRQRHKKYGETAYYLEPNIKHSPGGLRDLQTLLSISKRHFKISQFSEGIHEGFITEKEYNELMECQHFLWRIRFALHLLAGKAEERLSFDYQIKLAQFFGYEDQAHSLAIEQFMKDYFKIIKRHRALNEMLLQWFDETIAYQQKQKLVPLDTYFQLSNHYIEVRDAKLFQKQPKALFSLFLWIAQRSDIEGIKASTIRLIRESLPLINQKFKENIIHTQLFMTLLKANNPYEAIQLMSRYGILGQYLSCFSVVTGQMQYDLFHIYTVEQHTLFVIRNLYRFNQEEYASFFPLCAQISKHLDQPEILYLSALFHDIAKGRGGDHSELGAQEAALFAKHHQLPQQETQLLVWLVQHHLLMSQTAQRKDIYDLSTLDHFCDLLPQAYYLDYLYLLTVADICGTNPTLWNAWKDSLLKELYHAAKARMQTQRLINEDLLIQKKKEQALLLLTTGISYDESIIHNLWSQFKGKYFLHETPEAIACHTKNILESSSFPLVMIMPHHTQGGVEILIYMPHKDERFTITTTVLANHHVTIQEALISTCDNHFDLDIYIILDEKNQPFWDSFRFQEIQKALIHSLTHSHTLPKVIPKRLPRTWAHFPPILQITFNEHPNNQYTELFLVTNDKPGLLALISRLFFNLSIHLHNAKIVTAGERAEDTFSITNLQGLPLNAYEQEQVKITLLRELAIR